MTDRDYLSIGEVLALLLEEFPDVTISKIRFWRVKVSSNQSAHLLDIGSSQTQKLNVCVLSCVNKRLITFLCVSLRTN